MYSYIISPVCTTCTALSSSKDCVSLVYLGTPPRLDGRTIDYSVCAAHDGDDPPIPFSFMNDTVWIKVTVYPCSFIY
jgi:tRNA U34 5-carboxymethylaminomethyl modifying enzyme MnmG/GidA